MHRTPNPEVGGSTPSAPAIEGRTQILGQPRVVTVSVGGSGCLETRDSI